MKLNEDQWSHNSRGMHNEGPPVPLPIDQLVHMKMGWCKLTVIDREYTMAIAPLLANNITPMIRIYRPQPGANPGRRIISAPWRNTRAQARVGSSSSTSRILTW